MPRQTHFKAEWFSDERFKGWLKQKSSSEAMCGYCFNKVINVGNMGESALKSHAQSAKHKLRSPKPSTVPVIAPRTDSTSSTSTSGTSVTISTSESATTMSKSVTSTSTILITSPDPVPTTPMLQTLIDDSLTKDGVLFAEMRWCLNVVMQKASFRSCDSMGDLLRSMFPNCYEAERFSMGKTKCAYLVNFGFAPYFTEMLMITIKGSPFYALSFDESLNKSQQNGQMDINVRFWDSEKCIAETRYLTSEFLGRAKAEDILESFTKATAKLDASKLLQVASDGPNVNLKFLQLYDQKRQFLELMAVINIGVCGLHTVHGSLKAGIKASDWKVGKVLKAMHFLLHDFPSRQDLYIQYTETNVMPLPYCGHRWCENEKACERAALIWDAYCKYINYCLTLCKSKQPQGKRFDCLVIALKDPLIKAKFKLLEYVAMKLNCFLRGFQTDKPMVPFLYGVLKEIVDSLLQMFVKREICDKSDTLQKLLNLDLSDVNIRKKIPDIGVGAKLIVMDYKKSKGFNDNTLKTFYKECGTFLSSLIQHMLEKSPLRRQIVRCASALDPNLMVDKDEQESSALKFTHLCTKITQLQRISDSVANRASEEYKKFLKDVLTRHRDEFLEFDKYKDRVDTLLHRFMSSSKEYSNLFLVCQLVFILFHGQAHVERGFKTNKDFVKDNQKELSLVNLRIVHEHMLVNSYEPHTIPFTHDMVKNVKKAHSRYKTYLDEQTKSRQLNSKELKRKVVCDELIEVRKKKACYEDIIKKNTKDADKFSSEAEEKQDFTLLSQSNSLRQANLEKQKLIDELKKIEAQLIIRRDSIL